MWVVNESTDKMKDLVDRRSFAKWLKEVEPQAKPPAASLRSIRVRPGFTVDLAAAEPLVVDPVAFDWGPDGRMWVAEMVDYPTGLEKDGKPAGHVKCLEDTDGDGHYDRATVFLDGVPFPIASRCGARGLSSLRAPTLCMPRIPTATAAPTCAKILYHGFGEGNQQHRVNGLTFGLDNWLHCANGDSGGQIESTKTGDKIPLSFRDFRIQPDTGALELLLGQSQFTRVRDDCGQLVWLERIASRCISSCSKIVICAATVTWRLPTAGLMFRWRRWRRLCFLSAARCRDSTISTS